ncbi:MAG TPA: zinc ribbon domain-containing protein [Tepidisphaeraceae bacterium]|nr:zinc ribbon domain-containing protein [Tepidisphaeraceae bacterium]
MSGHTDAQLPVSGRGAGPSPTCGRCGYAVRGLPELTCPECGSDLRRVGIRTAGGAATDPRAVRSARWALFVAVAGGTLLLALWDVLASDEITRSVGGVATSRRYAVLVEATDSGWVWPLRWTRARAVLKAAPPATPERFGQTPFTPPAIGAVPPLPAPATPQAVLGWLAAAGVDTTDPRVALEAADLAAVLGEAAAAGPDALRRREPIHFDLNRRGIASPGDGTPGPAHAAFAMAVLVMWYVGHGRIRPATGARSAGTM